ncbi:unnamed protein product, partial [Nesidiocoris tenuis]
LRRPVTEVVPGVPCRPLGERYLGHVGCTIRDSFVHCTTVSPSAFTLARIFRRGWGANGVAVMPALPAPLALRSSFGGNRPDRTTLAEKVKGGQSEQTGADDRMGELTIVWRVVGSVPAFRAKGTAVDPATSINIKSAYIPTFLSFFTDRKTKDSRCTAKLLTRLFLSLNEAFSTDKILF